MNAAVVHAPHPVKHVLPPKRMKHHYFESLNPEEQLAYQRGHKDGWQACHAAVLAKIKENL